MNNKGNLKNFCHLKFKIGEERVKLETLEIKQGNGGTYRVSHDGAWVGAPSISSLGDGVSGERIDAGCYESRR